MPPKTAAEKHQSQLCDTKTEGAQSDWLDRTQPTRNEGKGMKPFPTDRASNIQNQCFTVAVGTQLTISHDQTECANRVFERSAQKWQTKST
jgi:hypothetical protein